ncbi:lytic transglycosylase Slt [Methylosoma difficile]
MNRPFFKPALVGCFLWFLPCLAMAGDLAQQRQDFLQAEQLLTDGGGVRFWLLGISLKDYPLYPYLQYQRLSQQLSETEQIQAFLSDYANTRYAELLRGKWLAYLAEQQRWSELVSHYLPQNQDVSLQCLFYWAQYQSGNPALALDAAKGFWLSGESQPKSCDALLTALTKSPQMTSDLLWQRFTLALANDNVALAEYVRRLLPASEQKTAETWLKIHKKPALIVDNAYLTGDDRISQQILLQGISRLAQTDLDLALSVWDGKRPLFASNDAAAQRVDNQLALALAHKRDSRAYNHLSLLSAPDAEAREWRVRAALLEQDWPHVSAALAGLTAEQQNDPHWQYWQARAFTEAGQLEQAQALFRKVAENRSFYGFLAADASNQPYRFDDFPVQVDEMQMQALANEADFLAASELNALNRPAEFNRQWQFACKKLPKERLMLAAKLAQRWQMPQLAIKTLVKADYWDDLSVRFPVLYEGQAQNNSALHHLNPALLLGLMRQESMLDAQAESPVGAKGLMQLMPDTAKQVARELSENWQGGQSLYNPDTNIRLGSRYFKKLLDRFDGHAALATAAYNAGPNRIPKWLPALKPMPADSWVETIPYKETRKYVTSVLTYALIYQQRLQSGSLKMQSLMTDVLPR